ncbi:hypothetical protein RRG08_023847 [Elysia crispata]|uniref:Uncharacterized protein n=1 Tax=Elysia crispata TaxID=231223 RepID=A0AAE1E3Y8_9GAST|nr:hypothetical protein RRG08_023847 [Elysia crispata]
MLDYTVGFVDTARPADTQVRDKTTNSTGHNTQTHDVEHLKILAGNTLKFDLVGSCSPHKNSGQRDTRDRDRIKMFLKSSEPAGQCEIQ